MAFNIWNRRYTGSKLKLSDWIVDLIKDNCEGQSFCDLFAGTAVVTAKMLPHMKTIHINDLLYSNEIIYQAFFMKGKFSLKKIENYAKKYLEIIVTDIEENYISKNFGDKFFEKNDAKIIGFIREDIASLKNLSKKERAILLASLIYSADRSANTVGHYDAYIKGKEVRSRFKFEIIAPVNTTDKEVFITREDANILAKKIRSDIVYIDPPYNSRQYSRFYHILENIVLWRKPILTGVALKPPSENMSEYCRRNAKTVFKDLIDSLNCKYIVVSYNNTYASKSKSSRNKIEITDIIEILRSKGEMLEFEKKHQFFNAGKTEFNNHKEFVFIVKVGK